MRYHLTPIRMTTIEGEKKKQEDLEKLEFLGTADGNVRQC